MTFHTISFYLCDSDGNLLLKHHPGQIYMHKYKYRYLKAMMMIAMFINLDISMCFFFVNARQVY